MKRGTPEHPKTLDLAEQLGIDRWGAVGLLELLWHTTAKHHPEGHIGKWPNRLIAKALYWQGDPDQLVEAFVSAGFLDKVEANRLVIHDWLEHAEDSVKRYLKRREESGLVRTSSDLSPSRARALPEPLPLPEPKPRKEREARSSRVPPDLLLTEEHRALASRHKVARVEHEFSKFVAHYQANGVRKIDWMKAWLSWCLKAGEFVSSNGNGAARERYQATPVIPSVEETRRMMRAKGLA